QGLEPPPTPAPRRGFWPWSRSSGNYRYLTRSVIEAIRRAPVKRRRWQFIVVHNSGTRQGNARVFDYYHRRVRRMQNGLAYHFVIGNGTSTGNGQVEVGDRWRRQINGGPVHSDYLKKISLGLFLVGDFSRAQPTRAQLDACEELIRYLRERCGKTDRGAIPVRPHREMNPPRWPTDCPGDDFPYSWFRRFCRKSLPISHDQIRFLVVPAITESEVERRRIALPKKFLEPGLIMLFEKIDGAEVDAKKTQVPLVWIEISQGNSGVVLHDPGTMVEN